MPLIPQAVPPSSMATQDYESPKVSPVKATINWKSLNLLSEAVHQGSCSICGFISGIQALESRVAIATENYQKWSIQNVIVCHQAEDLCAPIQPYHLQPILVEHPDYIIPASASPLTRRRCLGEGRTCTCWNSTTAPPALLLLHQQWFYLGAPVTTATAREAEIALQSGPLTTCFRRAWDRKTGDQCEPGCAHANSIIGYDEHRWYLQESLGPGFTYPKNASESGPVDKGTWFVDRGTECERAILRKAKSIPVYYNYNKANAFYTKINMADVTLTMEVEPSNFSGIWNLGIAKNRCSLLGVKCKGVLQRPEGSQVGLISFLESRNIRDFPKSLHENLDVHMKTQMVVYLKHESGAYLGINNKSLRLLPVVKSHAAPFFIADSKFISYYHPHLSLAPEGLTPWNDSSPSWGLKDANLRNLATGLSLTVDNEGKVKAHLFERNLTSQRFDLSLGGTWKLRSVALDTTLKRGHKGHLSFTNKAHRREELLRWQARHILTYDTRAFTSTWGVGKKPFAPTDFSLVAEGNVAPTDTLLEFRPGSDLFLGLMKNAVIVYHRHPRGSFRWTFEYANV